MSKIKLEIHHGGRLQLSPTIAYIGGRKDIYENFDPDFITVTDIAAFIIKECGYSNYSTIWYRFEVDDFSDIFIFEKDKDVVKILNTLQNNDCKVLQIFVEHEVDEEPEVVATASSTTPLLLTLTPLSQIDDDIGEGQSHRMDDDAHQERITNTVAIDPDEVDLTLMLEIHHGGRLQLSPTIAYIGGRKDIYENFDPDFIMVTDIAAFIIKECGFEVDDFPDIFVFEKDKDVKKILNTLQNNDCKVLQLFVEHEVDEEPEVVATASSTMPLLLTLTPQFQIDDDIGEAQSHQMDDDAHQEHTTITGAIDLDEVDLTSCEFPDSDAEQPDLFFEDGGKGKRVPQDNGGEQRDGVA
ncbi:transposase, MuDR, MULE transposase domain protein [Senna tora]|uniref:Transposase, MuDR, MULE transposase domain protein n=1 Tax=Senna tora TaxID=362788 RepID=A0A834TRX7_9FABA|nr:transposase, MuDR, MULE transposase domain protein [Senna tora]